MLSSFGEVFRHSEHIVRIKNKSKSQSLKLREQTRIFIKPDMWNDVSIVDFNVNKEI